MEEEKSGFGVLQEIDGSYYTGEFLNGLPDGRGRQSDPSGVTYIGSWRVDSKKVLEF